MRGRSLVLACVLPGLLLAGCGSIPKMLSVRHEQAVEASRMAYAAYRQGDYSSALANYEEALRLDRSIENADGIAINQINIARVYQSMGRDADAERRLDLLLQERAIVFRPEHLGAASIQKVQIALRADDAVGAAKWLDNAAMHCAGGCEFASVLLNLRASLALRLADADAALHWGRQGMAESADGEDVAQNIEHANGMRLTAQAYLLKQDAAAALPLLEQALEADKALGLPEKIRLDLLLLSEACRISGRTELAGQYLDRATQITASTTGRRAR